MVFQSYALYPHMTVYENLASGLKLRKVPPTEIKQRVAEVAEVLGLAELMNRKPGQMSGGQRQRVAVGRALVRNADVGSGLQSVVLWCVMPMCTCWMNR